MYFLNIFPMTTLQKVGYASVASMLTITQSFAALNFRQQDANQLQGASGATGADAIMNLIARFLGFVTIIAVIYVLWAGFQILTAGGNDEKVKQGRTTIIQVIIGIVVMWLAYSVVSWVISTLV